MAAMGGMRAARSAGHSAAPTVTSEAEREREPDGAWEHDDLAARDAEPERVDERHQQPRDEHADREPGGGRGPPTTAASSTTAAMTC